MCERLSRICAGTPTVSQIHLISGLERMTGLEPVASAWKAEVLPLYDIRMLILRLANLELWTALEVKTKQFLHAL